MMYAKVRDGGGRLATVTSIAGTLQSNSERREGTAQKVQEER
jgi:hypothetical protein